MMMLDPLEQTLYQVLYATLILKVYCCAVYCKA